MAQVLRRPSIAALAAGILIAPIVGCTGQTPTDTPGETVTAAASTSAEPTPSATSEAPETSAEPSPSSSEAVPSETASGDPEGQRPTGPVEATLKPGETASTQYFDVTMLKRDFNDQATVTGIEVKVCYVAEHPGANDDGTTRVSTDPWRFGVYDGETRTEADVHFLPVSEFDPSTAFIPAYEEKNLKVGECNEGWISVDHGNPDLAWASVRYQPADFGDVVTWDLGS